MFSCKAGNYRLKWLKTLVGCIALTQPVPRNPTEVAQISNRYKTFGGRGANGGVGASNTTCTWGRRGGGRGKGGGGAGPQHVCCVGRALPSAPSPPSASPKMLGNAWEFVMDVNAAIDCQTCLLFAKRFVVRKTGVSLASPPTDTSMLCFASLELYVPNELNRSSVYLNPYKGSRTL